MGPRTAAAYPDSLFENYTSPPTVSHRNTAYKRKIIKQRKEKKNDFTVVSQVIFAGIAAIIINIMYWPKNHSHLLCKVPGLSGVCQGHPEI